MEFWTLLVIGAAAWFVGWPIWLAFADRKAKAQVRILAGRVAALEARLSERDDRAAETPSAAPLFEALPEAPPTAEALPRDGGEERAMETPPPVSPPAEPAETGPPVPERNWEKVLAENWLVWLGGVALALGGAFLVKLSVEHGLLMPPVRVALGVLLGVGLWAAAGKTAGSDRRAGGTGASHVPSALAAAGSVAVFAAVFAAYQLYDLIPAGPAFPLLAATAAVTVLLSLRHGAFVAGLGLVGAYAIPLLVRGSEPNAAALFAYLGVVCAASSALLRLKAWWLLAWLSLAGTVGWALSWLAVSPDPADVGVIGAFLLGDLALFMALRRGIPVLPSLAGVVVEPKARTVVRGAMWTISIALFAAIVADGFGTLGLVYAFAATLGLLWFAFRDEAFIDAVVIAGGLPPAVLAAWTLPLPVASGDWLSRVVPPERVSDFIGAGIGFGLVLGLAGFLALPKVAKPGRWAALSAAAPLVLLVVAYWRLQRFDLDIGWAAGAVGLGALNLAAANRVAKHRDGRTDADPALAAYAVGVLGGTILAATMALQNAWLTVALAAHPPALAWVEERLNLPVLRRLALLTAGLVLVRLALNPEVLQYPLSTTPIFNWLLYGYGVPAAAFIMATRRFGRRGDDMLVEVLEGGAAVFTTLLVTFELRHLLNHGTLDFDMSDHSLFRDSGQVVAWLALAWGLLHLGSRRRRRVLSWAGILLFGLATTQAVLWQAMIVNPLWSGATVGGWFPFDTLGAAYAAPAVLYGGIAASRVGPPLLWKAARPLALGFALLWLTLEIRHAFHGEILTGALGGDAEWYAYSAGWLVFALLCLAVGLKRRSPWLRRVALAIIGLVIGKVFLFDTAHLGGVWRAVSFLGLGGALVGIGYAYRRLSPPSGT